MNKEQARKNLEGMSVVQEWATKIPFMQQSVLMAAVRGPDGLEKNHISKQLLRYLRRSFLYSAFESAKAGVPKAMLLPHTPGGGSFTGPCDRVYYVKPESNGTQMWMGCEVEGENAFASRAMRYIVDQYLQKVDEIPHHFQLHFMHAAEILGYNHPNDACRSFWDVVYHRLVNDAHLYPETKEQMDKRLSDVELYWRDREEVVAK